MFRKIDIKKKKKNSVRRLGICLAKACLPKTLETKSGSGYSKEANRFENLCDS